VEHIGMQRTVESRSPEDPAGQAALAFLARNLAWGQSLDRLRTGMRPLVSEIPPATPVPVGARTHARSVAA